MAQQKNVRRRVTQPLCQMEVRCPDHMGVLHHSVLWWGVMTAISERNGGGFNCWTDGKAENRLLSDVEGTSHQSQVYLEKAFIKRSSLLLLPPLVGEFQQGSLVLDTQNAAEQLNFNLNEKGPVCIYSVLSVTPSVLWGESREGETGLC